MCYVKKKRKEALEKTVGARNKCFRRFRGKTKKKCIHKFLLLCLAKETKTENEILIDTQMNRLVFCFHTKKSSKNEEERMENDQTEKTFENKFSSNYHERMRALLFEWRYTSLWLLTAVQRLFVATIFSLHFCASLLTVGLIKALQKARVAFFISLVWGGYTTWFSIKKRNRGKPGVCFLLCTWLRVNRLID